MHPALILPILLCSQYAFCRCVEPAGDLTGTTWERSPTAGFAQAGPMLLSSSFPHERSLWNALPGSAQGVPRSGSSI